VIEGSGKITHGLELFGMYCRNALKIGKINANKFIYQQKYVLMGKNKGMCKNKGSIGTFKGSHLSTCPQV